MYAVPNPTPSMFLEALPLRVFSFLGPITFKETAMSSVNFHHQNRIAII